MSVDDNPAAERRTGQADLRWRCPECGELHRKNNPPCDHCGTMSLEAVEASDVDPDETPESAPGPGSRGWYLVAAYAVALPVTVVALSLEELLPSEASTLLFPVVALVGTVYVLGFVIVPVGFFLDARSVRASPGDWSPNPWLFAGASLAVLYLSMSGGPAQQSVAASVLGPSAAFLFPLLALALCWYYLYRRHQHVGTP